MPEETETEENDADEAAPGLMKAAVRSASTSASVFSQNEDGSYVLLNHSGTETLSADDDVTISAAGLNRLGAISVNGNINLVGTGILLVDEIEMAEGKEFLLQPNREIYGENGGSVAVFLKQDNGEYLLVNGSVDGILDEEYEIPADVTLVVPGGSRLVMQSVTVGRYTSVDGEESILYSTDSESAVIQSLPGYETDGHGSERYDGEIIFQSTSPKLTLLEQAKLVIQEQASLLLNGIGLRYGGFLAPLLEVSGTLEQNGSVSGSVVTVDKTGDLTGSGIFTGTRITVNGGRSEAVTSLNISNTRVLLDGSDADLGTVMVSGKSSLVYTEASSVNKAEVTENTILSVYTKEGYGSNRELTFRNGISGGGSIELHSGICVLGEDCKVSDGTVVAARSTWLNSKVSITMAAIYDYYLDENGHANLTPNETPRVETRDAPQTVNGGDIVTIPCIVTTLTNTPINMDYDISIGLESAERESTLDYSDLKSQGDTVTLSYQTLIDRWSGTDYYKSNYSEAETPSTPVILLETEAGGRWSSVVLSNANPEGAVPAKDVKRIRLLVLLPAAHPSQGGGTVTSTNTTYTGSGILGGSGAGSLSGGNSTMILRGTGLHKDEPAPAPAPDPTPDPTPDPIPDLTPDPAPDPTPDPTPDPDPVPLVATVEETPNAPLIWAEVSPAASTDAASPAEAQYVVLALEGEKTLEELGGKATISMNYTLPAEYADQPLYVVFRNEDGTLTAIRATYSNITGLLRFLTDRLGTFMVVGFDFDGLEFSEEFYAALAQLDVLKDLAFAEYSPV